MSKYGKLIYASSENCADIFYAVNMFVPDEFIYFSIPDEGNFAVFSGLEYSRALAQAKTGVTVWCDKDVCGKEQNSVSDIITAVSRKFDVKCWQVPDKFPYRTACELQHCGLEVILPDKGTRFFPEREFKSDDEIEKIKVALRAAEAGCRRGIEILRHSEVGAGKVLYYNGAVLTSEVLRAEIDAEQMRCGAMPQGTICAGAKQGAQPHNCGSGPLFADTPIVMDIFPRSVSSGFWGDLTRTVVKGHAAPIVCKAFEAVKKARDEVKPFYKIGGNPAEIHRLAADIMADCGFPTGHSVECGDYGFFHGLGHGVGLEIHEAPRISPRNNVLLRGNEVVTDEPGLYYQEWGGIRLEDMIVVREDGGETLTEIETELEI